MNKSDSSLGNELPATKAAGDTVPGPGTPGISRHPGRSAVSLSNRSVKTRGGSTSFLRGPQSAFPSSLGRKKGFSPRGQPFLSGPAPSKSARRSYRGRCYLYGRSFFRNLSQCFLFGSLYKYTRNLKCIKQMKPH